MSVVEQPAVLTPTDLLSLPDGDRFELVDGKLMEKQMSALANIVVAEALFQLSAFVRQDGLGYVVASECGYQCFPDKPQQVRKPDASFIRKGRLPAEQLERGHVRIAPDLAVEVVSPNDSYYDVDRKVEEFLSAGASVFWVVNPETRTVGVHRPDGTAVRLHENDELTGEDVLPGFRCRVGLLFPKVDAQ